MVCSNRCTSYSHQRSSCYTICLWVHGKHICGEYTGTHLFLAIYMIEGKDLGLHAEIIQCANDVYLLSLTWRYFPLPFTKWWKKRCNDRGTNSSPLSVPCWVLINVVNFHSDVIKNYWYSHVLYSITFGHIIWQPSSLPFALQYLVGRAKETYITEASIDACYNNVISILFSELTFEVL